MTPAALTSDAIKTKGPGAVDECGAGALWLRAGTASGHSWVVFTETPNTHVLGSKPHPKLSTVLEHLKADIWCWQSISGYFVVQSLSRVQLFATPWTAARQTPLSSTVSWSLLRFMSIESAMLSNHLILCHPLSSCPQPFPASRSFPMSRLFTSGGQSIGASALASVLPMKFRVDFL